MNATISAGRRHNEKKYPFEDLDWELNERQAAHRVATRLNRRTNLSAEIERYLNELY